MNKNILGEKIKEAVKKTGLTQTEFERKFDISENLVSRWIKGDRNPSIKSLKKIAEATKTPLDFFLDNSLISDITPSSKTDINDKINLILQKITSIESEIKSIKTKISK